MIQIAVLTLNESVYLKWKLIAVHGIFDCDTYLVYPCWLISDSETIKTSSSFGDGVFYSNHLFGMINNTIWLFGGFDRYRGSICCISLLINIYINIHFFSVVNCLLIIEINDKIQFEIHVCV